MNLASKWDGKEYIKKRKSFHDLVLLALLVVFLAILKPIDIFEILVS
jgi:hypothetical protein